MSDEAPNPRQAMWDERHAARDPIESREPEAVLVELAGRLEPGRALDLATGDGRNAVWLASRGWVTTAVDFSRIALDRARALADHAGASVTWVHEDLLAWRPPARSFDLVMLAFLHLPAAERQHVYGAAADAVAPGGHLVVVGHDRVNAGRGVPGPQDPEVLFTADEVAAGLSGFAVERSEAVERDLGDGRIAVDAVVVARRPDG